MLSKSELSKLSNKKLCTINNDIVLYKLKKKTDVKFNRHILLLKKYERYDYEKECYENNSGYSISGIIQLLYAFDCPGIREGV